MSYICKTHLTVRYSETDQMGIVHHSRYFPWFEAGRTEYTKKLGMSYGDMERSGIMMPLIEACGKYIKGAKYEDEITVETTIAELGAVRCRFEYKIIREHDGKLLATGSTTHAFVDSSFKPVNLKKKDPQLWALWESLCA